MVASCSDFSMVERPPVSENRTPTLISPAALAPVWKTHGEVITVLPASKPSLRNLRLSIAITPLPIVCGRKNPFAPKHVVPNQKFPDQTAPRKRDCVVGDLRSAKTKSPTDPRGSFGLPSQSQTSIIDGPTKCCENILPQH